MVMRVAVAAALVFASRVAHADPDARPQLSLETMLYGAIARPMQPQYGYSPARARDVYGGGLELAFEPALRENGFVVRVGGVIERQSDCAAGQPGCVKNIPGAEGATIYPLHQIESGLHGRVGWAWRFVQIETGVLAYTRVSWAKAAIVPDLVVRAGPRRLHVDLGWGTFTAPTLMNPGPYVQANVSVERGSFSAAAGYSEADSYNRVRVDTGADFDFTRHLRIGVGAMLTHADGHTGPDLRARLITTF